MCSEHCAARRRRGDRSSWQETGATGAGCRVDTGPGGQAVRKTAREYFDPEALLESIANGSIALTRGRWVVKHFEAGGKLVRRQDLPPEAFFTVDELRKLVAALGDNWGLLFVAISYRWLTAIHPDPDAFHLNIVAKVAKLYLKPESDNRRW